MAGFSSTPIRRSFERMAPVERALAEERAGALGRVGDRLAEAIDTYELLLSVGAASEPQLEQALREIRDAAWSLLVQRECVGFRQDNLGWIRRHYAIPSAALRRL